MLVFTVTLSGNSLRALMLGLPKGKEEPLITFQQESDRIQSSF